MKQIISIEFLVWDKIECEYNEFNYVLGNNMINKVLFRTFCNMLNIQH